MLDTIVLGGGCFWCVESVFLSVVGVKEVESGYAGGNTKNPDYRSICSGKTGHAEVVKVSFDTEKISLSQILEIFFATHDPTTPNRQGNDVGTQ
ncbi:MAG: peptide-methionine (S)-S-oxide reductase MsrA, partial [Trichodesmium sp. St16_bin4-tuft]|nr:peptide-methionine (S)-S-oxide reductase MsrA [Trichodesmium sp. St16_bin4-tuft]